MADNKPTSEEINANIEKLRARRKKHWTESAEREARRLDYPSDIRPKLPPEDARQKEAAPTLEELDKRVQNNKGRSK